MKAKVPLAKAEKIASRVVEKLMPYCQRIEIAGSIRRRKSEAGDIDIVAEPKRVPHLFGVPFWQGIPTENLGLVVKNGLRYKQVLLTEKIYLDLFIVHPLAQLGVILAIHTGSTEFSHKLVSHPPYGYLPKEYIVKDGAI
jgi:DNA polymerase/3'-5' exonuclease PolX